METSTSHRPLGVSSLGSTEVIHADNFTGDRRTCHCGIVQSIENRQPGRGLPENELMATGAFARFSEIDAVAPTIWMIVIAANLINVFRLL